MQPAKSKSIFNIAVIVAALGYFVDIYDLLLFTIVREPSLRDLGVSLQDGKAVLAASTKIINWQMVGLLIGGIVWGIMGDKKGRLSVLFGSIILYSVANFITGFVQTTTATDGAEPERTARKATKLITKSAATASK